MTFFRERYSSDNVRSRMSLPLVDIIIQLFAILTTRLQLQAEQSKQLQFKLLYRLLDILLLSTSGDYRPRPSVALEPLKMPTNQHSRLACVRVLGGSRSKAEQFGTRERLSISCQVQTARIWVSCAAPAMRSQRFVKQSLAHR